VSGTEVSTALTSGVGRAEEEEAGETSGTVGVGVVSDFVRFICE